MMERKNSLSSFAKEKIIFNKRIHFLKDNFLTQENSTSYCDNLTFRDNIAEKENSDPNELKTITKKEKNPMKENLNGINSNLNQNSSMHLERKEKQTPGFPKHQQKISRKIMKIKKLSVNSL